MLIIGFLIVVAVAVFAGVVLSDNWGGSTVSITGFGHVLGNLTMAEVFLSGVVLTAIFFVGAWLIMLSSRMRRRASRTRRAETRAARQEREEIAAERDRLARELESARANAPIAEPVTQQMPVVTEPVVTERPTEVRLPDTERFASPTPPPAYPGGPAEGYGQRLIDPTDPRDATLAADEARRHTV
jgi:uncharacterized membrane protein